MARNRTPLAKAHVSGAAMKHPERYGNRTSNKHARPIGEPFPNMTDGQKAFWREMAEDLPWLNSAHRVLLRLACFHAARLDTESDFGVSATQALSSLLSKLGATPVDESRIFFGADEEDPEDVFFGRPN